MCYNYMKIEFFAIVAQLVFFMQTYISDNAVNVKKYFKLL